MSTITTTFQDAISQGIPSKVPELKAFDASINHAPKRKDILSDEEKELALRNALR
jgi:urocanate hydratase